MPPNTLLELTHYGVPGKPGAPYRVHHHAPGLQGTPP
jgi:hypothetical protein